MRLPAQGHLDALAAEYVLGTLKGPARRRMVRWVREISAVRQLVQAWEDRLSPLAMTLPPAEPSPQVWTEIRRRIKALDRDQRPARVPASTQNWRWAAAAVVLLGIFALLWNGPMRAPQTHLLADVHAANGQVLWQVAVTADEGRIRVRAVNPEARSASQDFELWALPTGGNPVSLGVIPVQGEISRDLNAAQRLALHAAAKFAVSLEPRGGSPTGAPTGPIVHVVDALRS